MNPKLPFSKLFITTPAFATILFYSCSSPKKTPLEKLFLKTPTLHGNNTNNIRDNIRA